MGSSEIVGVVEDFHERSVQEPILASMYTPGQGYTKFITVKINSNDASQTIEQLQQQWATVFPEKPFDYFFLDEYFDRQYQKEATVAESVWLSIGYWIGHRVSWPFWISPIL
jgi:putative ABC transport system permease protein